MQTQTKKKYPFNEGDDYYTIEKNIVIWSAWDDVSEYIYDNNPNIKYFKTKKEAENFLKKNTIMEKEIENFNGIIEYLDLDYDEDFQQIIIRTHRNQDNKFICLNIDLYDFIKSVNESQIKRFKKQLIKNINNL